MIFTSIRRNGHRVTPVVLVALTLLPGCGTSSPTSTDGTPIEHQVNSQEAPPVANPRDTELTPDQTATVQIYSSPAGCLVLIDQVPLRNEEGDLALTPCEVRMPKASHSISVEKPDGRRSTRLMEIREDVELQLDLSSTDGESEEAPVWNAPFLEAAVGRAIPLKSLNSAARDLDPFLTADGCAIYFTSDRGGIKGVYTSTRPTVYHDFGDVKIVDAASGSDLPVSPSVSGDGLTMIYAVVDKSRLWELRRKSTEQPFGNKEIIRSDDKGERLWRSAQLSNDSLRLYWTEEGDTMLTRAATRTSPDKLFSKTIAYDLPGYHPHISSDGLRQFLFDGTTLSRCRRGTIRQPFGEPEVVVELNIEDYRESPQHRQFWVTDDEQWLFYNNKVNSTGDLFVVRLSEGPIWGRSYVGKPLKDKMNVATIEKEEKSKDQPKPAETVDPRTLPLPYTVYWGRLVKLLEQSKGDEAVELVQAARANPQLRGDQELLAWDLALAEAFVEFERDVQAGLRALKPGSAVRIGGTRFDFERTDGTTLFLKLKDKEVTKKLADLSPGERISIAETGQEKAEGDKAYRYGLYLHFQGKLQQPVAEGWLKRAGDRAEQFHEQLAARILHQGKAELARGKMAEAIRFLDAVAASEPGTMAARQAAQQRESLYRAIEWKTVGPRKWKSGDLGEYAADGKKSNGSYLTVDKSYRDFELSCEWMVAEPAAIGGVYFRYGGQGRPLDSGAKIQLANDSDLKKLDRFATGALLGVTTPETNASLPAGKWNTLRMQVRGQSVQVWINEKEVLKTELGNKVPASGSVMLDGVTGGISYRKILLFELD